MATATNPKSELATQAKRAEVVKHRLAGKTNVDIAALVGITESGVRWHTTEWLAAQTPSTEQTEELRQIQAAQIDAIADKLWPNLEDPELALATTDRLVKLMDRKARLMGIDLERSQFTINVTRESLAASLGWAPAVDVEAEEITDGGGT